MNQFAIQMAANKIKLSSTQDQQKLRVCRSRNIEKIDDIRNRECSADAFNTHRGHNQISNKNQLLNMFTSFLSNEKNTFNDRKCSHKNERHNLLATQNNLNDVFKKTEGRWTRNLSPDGAGKLQGDLRSEYSGFKPGSKPHGNEKDKSSIILEQSGEDFNIFKSKRDDKPIEEQKKTNDMFNLMDLNDEIFNFDSDRVVKPKASFKKAEDTTAEDHRNTTTD